MVLKRVRWTILTPLIVLLAGACSGDDNETVAPSATTIAVSTTTTAPSSTTTLDERATVTAAYEAASRAFIDAAAIPDPDAPAVAATHVGPMLDQRRTTLLGLKAEGKAIRYPTPSQYRIEIEDAQLDGDVARLTVCVVDDGQRVAVREPAVSSAAVTSVRGRAAMRRVDGVWKLAERTETQRWDGVAGCAID